MGYLGKKITKDKGLLGQARIWIVMSKGPLFEREDPIYLRLPPKILRQLCLILTKESDYRCREMLLRERQTKKKGRSTGVERFPYRTFEYMKKDKTTLWVKPSYELATVLGISFDTMKQWVYDRKVVSKRVREGSRYVRKIHYNDLKRYSEERRRSNHERAQEAV